MTIQLDDVFSDDFDPLKALQHVGLSLEAS